jgi:CHASE1-domain containing sensor protein
MPDLSEYTRKWRPVRHIWPIVAAACLGLAVAVAAWFAVAVWEQRLARAKFNDVAGDYAAVLQSGLDDYLGKILAVRAFYDSSHAVDPNEFALFTGRILEGHDAIMRITWSPRVTRDERAEFERKARDEGIEGYEITAWATGGTLASPRRRMNIFRFYIQPAYQLPCRCLVSTSTLSRCAGRPWSARAMATACLPRLTSSFAMMLAATGVAFS